MTIIEILLKASVLMGLAALAHALLARRTSAATRHLVWTLAIAGLLLLPILAAALPGWTALELSAPQERLMRAIVASADNATEEWRQAVPADGPSAWPLDVTSDITAVASTASAPAPADRRIRWSTAIAIVYLAGVLLLLGRAAAERVSIRRLAHRAIPVSGPAWIALLHECRAMLDVRRPVTLLRSLQPTMPMAFGIRRAAILVPAGADEWTDDRRRAVLLHELAHVARHDCLTQTLAAVACAVYWVHPGIWWIARRLRVERELACDDRVLSAGADARDYAGHLLELAYTLGHNAPPALAVTMASSRQLEGRMLAVLDAARNRARPALRSRIAGLAVLAALLVPVAAAVVSSRTPDESPDAQQAIDSQAAPPEADPPQSSASGDTRPGTWEIRPSEEAGRVHLQLREHRSFYGSTIDAELLSGLSSTQLGAGGPVQFSIRRDAGTFSFEGVARSGVAAGTFEFIPDPGFAAELVKRGLGKITAAQQRLLARSDVGFDFIEELNAQGYQRTDLAQLVRAVEHGVTTAYLRDMGELGYRVGRIDRLIDLRGHDVTPRFIRGLAAHGLRRLSTDDLVNARNHDVSPEYIAGLAAVGYTSLDLDQLITLRSNDVTRGYVQGLAAQGYGPFDRDTILELRQHDVSAEFVEGLSELGYRKLPTDTLLRLRSHDVMPPYIRQMQGLGYRGLGIDELLTLREHDVQPRYVAALQDLGYRRLPVEELIDLRSHDVQPEEIRRANDGAGRQLTVERLIELASKGWAQSWPSWPFSPRR